MTLAPPIAIVAAIVLAGQLVPPAPPTSPAASQPAATRSFQPGVSIDWAGPAVRLSGRVVLRDGPVEFLACFPGKEHESIVLLDASATSAFLALGLAGFEPGQPVHFDEQRERMIPATGQPVDVFVEWNDGGQARIAPATSWLREIELARPALDRPLVFCGAALGPDGRIAAERTGEGFAVVDQPRAFVAFASSLTDRNADLWCAALPDAIPPVDTPVTMVVRKAEPRPRQIRLDWRGTLRVDDRPTRARELAEALLLERAGSPGSIVEIQSEASLESDEIRLRQSLLSAGVAAESIRIVRSPAGLKSP